MNAVIIEDEALAAAKLKNLLAQCDPDIKVVAELSNVEEATRYFREGESPDLIFSDIQLSDGLSFDIFRNLKITCPIIFTTAYNQYAIEAFEHNSIGYLVKPYHIDKLSQALEKLKELKASKPVRPALDIDSLLQTLNHGQPAHKSRFLVKSGNKIATIKSDEIAYFLTDQKVTFLVTRENRKYPVDYSLDEVAQMVNPKDFFRINRKYVIHIDAAREINPYFKGRLKLTLHPVVDEEVIISSDKTAEFKTWLDQ